MTIEGEEALSGTPEKSLAPLAPIIGRWRIRAGDGRMTSRWERLVDARWQRWMDMQCERW